MQEVKEDKRKLRQVEPDMVNLLEDETRRRMITLLSTEEMTVSQIAEVLRLTPQNIYQQVKKLLEAGLVRVTREERSRHLIEKHYGAVAENFYYGWAGRGDLEPEDLPLKVLHGLKERGHDLDTTRENAERLSGILSSRRGRRSSPTHDMCALCGSSRVFIKIGSANALMDDTLLRLEGLMTMDDEEFDEYIEFNRRLRGFLRSISRADGDEGAVG
jgi:DNA-binding transcriptional ArsR family regulator